MPIELQTNISLETTPVDPKHLVSMRWVQEFFTGRIKAPVRAVATTNQAGTYAPAPDLTLTYTATGALVIDGVTLAVGDRVLLVGQSTATQNGIYTVTDAGSASTEAELTRATDFNESDLIYTGVTIAVNHGDAHANTTWKLITEGTLTLDATALEFISITPATGTAKYVSTITGDNTETEFVVQHNLGTIDVSVSIWNETTKSIVLTDVTIDDGNELTIGFAEPPSTSQIYRVVVIG